MILRMILITILMILGGCAHSDLPLQTIGEVKAYVMEFEEEFDVDVSDVDWRVVDELSKETYAGVCVGKWKQVYIKRQWWEEAGHRSRFWFVAHELGHCHFGWDHEEEGFMHPSIPSWITDRQFEEAMVLFHQRIEEL